MECGLLAAIELIGPPGSEAPALTKKRAAHLGRSA